MYHHHRTCRACGFTDLKPVFDLGLQPLANDFRSANEDQAGYAPLVVLFCPKCTLAQLSVVVDPMVLYRNYSYVTSPSETMRKHFDTLYDDLGVRNMRYVVEIGSNDGRMLKQWSQRDSTLAVLGIDPADNLTIIANANGVPSMTALFNERTAGDVLPGDPDLVICRHAFCHVDDWKGFIAGLENIGHKDTLYCIEVPYVMDLMNGCEFDTVYHEHLSYLSIKAMQCLLHDSLLHIGHVQRYSIHGGAILIHLRRNEAGMGTAISVDDFTEAEDIKIGTWIEFSRRAHARIQTIEELIASGASVGKEGKRWAAFGASAKSTVWMAGCGFTKNEIAFICDSTPQKQGKLSPGTDIPIVPESELLTQMPDFVLLTAWNFADEIVAKHKAYTDRGGKFVVPVPNVRVLP